MSEEKNGPIDLNDTDNEEFSDMHTDYTPEAEQRNGGTHHLSGMYQNWFLDYASYVILERAVPHINDGFKPVQRRILHSMKRMDDGRYNKVANIVGHTMQFHPHGDASIGDALVQMGQKDLLVDWPATGHILTATRPRHALARGTPVEIRPGRGVQSQDHRMEAVVRRTQQGAGHSAGQVSFAVGTRGGRHCRGPFVKNIAAQPERNLRCRHTVPSRRTVPALPGLPHGRQHRCEQIQ